MYVNDDAYDRDAAQLCRVLESSSSDTEEDSRLNKTNQVTTTY
jgi:hypothetical protein